MVGMRLLGYTRVSTVGQDPTLQHDALVTAGVQNRDVFSDVTSGAKNAIERPGMKKLLAYAQPGDTVVVWRIDRLGRSLLDVLNTVNLLREREVKIKSVSDGIDPETSPLVKQAGANVLVAGSAVFRQDDRATAIAAIRNA